MFYIYIAIIGARTAITGRVVEPINSNFLKDWQYFNDVKARLNLNLNLLCKLLAAFHINW